MSMRMEGEECKPRSTSHTFVFPFFLLRRKAADPTNYVEVKVSAVRIRRRCVRIGKLYLTWWLLVLDDCLVVVIHAENWVLIDHRSAMSRHPVWHRHISSDYLILIIIIRLLLQGAPRGADTMTDATASSSSSQACTCLKTISLMHTAV